MEKSKREPAPLQLTITSTAHPDPVRIDNMTAVVWRDSKGRFYIKLGHHRLYVTVNERFTYFELTVSETNIRFLYGTLKSRRYI